MHRCRDDWTNNLDYEFESWDGGQEIGEPEIGTWNSCWCFPLPSEGGFSKFRLPQGWGVNGAGRAIDNPNLNNQLGWPVHQTDHRPRIQETNMQENSWYMEVDSYTG